MGVCVFSHFSHVQLFATTWTVALQAPQPMGLSRQEYWSGLPYPPPGNLPNAGINLISPTLQADSLPLSHWGNPMTNLDSILEGLQSKGISRVFSSATIQKHQFFSTQPSFLVAQMVKSPPAMQETCVWSLDWEDPQEKGTATHSSILAWRIPWTENPSGLQSMDSQRVRHDWATVTSQPSLLSCIHPSIHTYIHISCIHTWRLEKS